MLVADAQRAPLLCAVGERLTTTARVRDAVRARYRLPQRAALLRLLDRLDAGCRSPLELRDYDHVFTGPGFEQLRWQVPVTLGSRTVWLDAYDEESRTNFELDGAAYHSSPADRERDLRRDAALAAIGIHAVRFSHARLRSEASLVSEEALRIMAIRRSLVARHVA